MNHLTIALATLLSCCSVLKAEDHQISTRRSPTERLAKATHLVESMLSADEKSYWRMVGWTSSEDSITVRLEQKLERFGIESPGTLTVSIYNVDDSDSILDINDLIDKIVTSRYIQPRDRCGFIISTDWKSPNEAIADIKLLGSSTSIGGNLRIVHRFVLQGREFISFSFEKWDDLRWNTFTDADRLQTWERRRAYWLDRFCEVDVGAESRN